MNGDVIDDNAKAILKQCPELEYMLGYIEKHLKETYPKVFDGTLNKVECVPNMYDYGVENKNAKKALAMQYGNEQEIKDRIEELESSKKFESQNLNQRKRTNYGLVGYLLQDCQSASL